MLDSVCAVSVDPSSYTTHEASMSIAIGDAIGTPSVFIPSNIVNDRKYDLAEHHLYGTSRLGIKEYYPVQIGLRYSDSLGFTDTTSLLYRKPWYSCEYNELIKKDSLNLYGNIFKDAYYTQDIRGLKQYELTDHLGNVLASKQVANLQGNTKLLKIIIPNPASALEQGDIRENQQQKPLKLALYMRMFQLKVAKKLIFV